MPSGSALRHGVRAETDCRRVGAALWPSFSGLKDGQGYLRAGLGVGQGMVVAAQVVSAAQGHGRQPVVGQRLAEGASRGSAGAVERVSGILHAVAGEHGLQAALVEGTVVGHQRQPLYQRGDVRPHGGEVGGRCRVLLRQPVYAGVPVAVIVGAGMDEPVDAVGHGSAPHHDHPHAAYARALAVGGLKVDGGKIFHYCCFLFVLRRYELKGDGSKIFACKWFIFRNFRYICIL